MRTEVTIENDTLDLVIFRAFGRVDSQLLSIVYGLNPELVGVGPILPPRTEVKLPETEPQQMSKKIQLYD